jgi:urate oxidase
VAAIQSSSYGESKLRMLRVLQRGDRHDPRDLTIALRFEGSLEAMVPGEAIKNLVHRVVREQEQAATAVEPLGLALCAAILERHPSIGLVRVDLAEQPWARLDAGGKQQPRAFTPAGGERRTASVSSNGTRVSVSAGLDNLVLLRTDGFAPVRRGRASDEATADGLQRLFIATLSARWSYTSGDIAFIPHRAGIRQAIAETFAWHKGPSVHATLTAIGDVLFASFQDISQVTLTVEERPYRPVDLLELSIDGDALFVARDEPIGVIEITMDRVAP